MSDRLLDAWDWLTYRRWPMVGRKTAEQRERRAFELGRECGPRVEDDVAPVRHLRALP